MKLSSVNQHRFHDNDVVLRAHYWTITKSSLDSCNDTCERILNDRSNEAIRTYSSHTTKQFKEVRSVEFWYVCHLKVDNNSRWNIMKCQITYFLNDLLCGYHWHFLAVCVYDRLPTASWNLKLSHSCMLNYANTLPSGGISLVPWETYLCCLYAVLAKLKR